MLNFPGNAPSVPVHRMRWENWISCSRGTNGTVTISTVHSSVADEKKGLVPSHPPSLQDHRLCVGVDPLHSTLNKTVSKRLSVRDEGPPGEACRATRVKGQRSQSVSKTGLSAKQIIISFITFTINIIIIITFILTISKISLIIFFHFIFNVLCIKDDNSIFNRSMKYSETCQKNHLTF